MTIDRFVALMKIFGITEEEATVIYGLLAKGRVFSLTYGIGEHEKGELSNVLVYASKGTVWGSLSFMRPGMIIASIEPLECVVKCVEREIGGNAAWDRSMD